MKNVSVQIAASRMGKSPQFVRLGLQHQRLPIGTAVKTGKKRWSYHISPALLDQYLGVTASEKEVAS